MSIMFRTDAQIDAALDALSQAEGVSKQEVLRRAVLERFEKSGHQVRVEQALQEGLEKWGDVLRRLGEA